jgi:ABC-type molybdate transport system substrate-binding protein
MRTKFYILVIVSALLTGAAAHAAQITVVTSLTFAAAYQELAPQYEPATHDKLRAG